MSVIGSFVFYFVHTLMEVNKFFSDLMIAKHCATIFADIRSVVGDDIRDLQIGLRVRDWV